MKNNVSVNSSAPPQPIGEEIVLSEELFAALKAMRK